MSSGPKDMIELMQDLIRHLETTAAHDVEDRKSVELALEFYRRTAEADDPGRQMIYGWVDVDDLAGVTLRVHPQGEDLPGAETGEQAIFGTLVDGPSALVWTWRLYIDANTRQAELDLQCKPWRNTDARA